MDEFEARVRALLLDSAFIRLMQAEPYVYREGGGPEGYRDWTSPQG